MAEAPKPKPAAAPAAADTAARSSGAAGWMPVIAIIVAVPALSFATAKFVIFPEMDKRFAAAAGASAPGSSGHGSATPAPAGHGSSGGHGSGKADGALTQAYEFKDVVSNLSGAQKSRYIKVTFTAYGSDAKFKEIIEGNRARLLDTTLGVLGSLSLAEMEDGAIKNKVRASLVQAFQTVLNGRLVEEVYFSEFVVQ